MSSLRALTGLGDDTWALESMTPGPRHPSPGPQPAGPSLPPSAGGPLPSPPHRAGGHMGSLTNPQATGSSLQATSGNGTPAWQQSLTPCAAEATAQTQALGWGRAQSPAWCSPALRAQLGSEEPREQHHPPSPKPRCDHRALARTVWEEVQCSCAGPTELGCITP